MDNEKMHRKKLEKSGTTMLKIIVNKSRKQHPTKQQLYSHLPSIPKTIQVRYEDHSWISKEELINNVHLSVLINGRISLIRTAKTYLQQVCSDAECSLKDLTGAMDDGYSRCLTNM